MLSELFRRGILTDIVQRQQPVDANTMMQVFTPPPQVDIPESPATQVVPPVNKSAVMTDYVTRPQVQQSPKVGEATVGMVPGAQPVQRSPSTTDSPFKKKRRFPTLVKSTPVA